MLGRAAEQPGSLPCSDQVSRIHAFMMRKKHKKHNTQRAWHVPNARGLGACESEPVRSVEGFGGTLTHPHDRASGFRLTRTSLGPEINYTSHRSGLLGRETPRGTSQSEDFSTPHLV